MTGIFVQFNVDSHKAKSDPVGWVEDGSGCHVWVGGRSRGGYGRGTAGGRERYMHVVRWEALHGPVPEGMELDHFACENRACCNPDHVRPASHRENLLRGNTMVARQVARTRCLNGHSLEDAGNLVPDGLKRGKRECRVCVNARWRKNYHLRRGAA